MQVALQRKHYQRHPRREGCCLADGFVLPAQKEQAEKVRAAEHATGRGTVASQLPQPAGMDELRHTSDAKQAQKDDLRS